MNSNSSTELPRLGFDSAAGHLRPYLQALWDQEFSLWPVVDDSPLQRPFISELGIHLPRHYASHQGGALRDLYRAAAAHAAAHCVFSTQIFERKKLKPVQIAIISLLEDARIEQLAIQEMPGLRRLWRQFFSVHSAQESNLTANALLLRLSLALLDTTVEDINPWIIKARQLYRESQQAHSDPLALRDIGSLLGNDLGQMRLRFDAKTYVIEPVYRDDNLFLWDSDAPPEETRSELSAQAQPNEQDETVPRMDDNATQELRVRRLPIAKTAEEAPPSAYTTVARYDEWDDRIGHYRRQWCTLIEETPQQADSSHLTALLASQLKQSNRLAQLLQARKQGLRQRPVRHTEGDDLELDAMVKAQIALRSGHDPDSAVFQRAHKHKPDLSVLVLIDLSLSTSRPIADGTSMLDLIKQASLLLGSAIEHSSDQWAIHGFRSNGRHQVHYLRLKEFNQPLDDQILQGMAALEGEWSTRMGAAIRHASQLMRQTKTQQRLILLLTDGEPHDIDMPWPTVLTKDATRAVAQSTAEGTPVFCVSVDSAGDEYLKEIFGSHRYRVIDNIEQLPIKLPELYLQLSV